MVGKGLLGWRYVTQAKIFNSTRVQELQNRHKMRTFYNIFFAWKHVKALNQANYIPIRISKTTSVSKTHGKLREVRSIDIKIVNH